ncbi:unnamed protein product [Paramecium octaurelia]|uniref:Uncharacterized protein n=1 Tax=Paramecium octaurelia TaxID=43137 RepID=A0A8S1YG25_PAROT|nr:unnamed protein product [Paramecium octaurelia]
MTLHGSDESKNVIISDFNINYNRWQGCQISWSCKVRFQRTGKDFLQQILEENGMIQNYIYKNYSQLYFRDMWYYESRQKGQIANNSTFCLIEYLQIKI